MGSFGLVGDMLTCLCVHCHRQVQPKSYCVVSCPVCRREVKVSNGSVVGMVEGWVMSGEAWVTPVL